MRKPAKHSCRGITIREMRVEDIAKVYRLGRRLFKPQEASTFYRTWDAYEVTNNFNQDPHLTLMPELRKDSIVRFALGTTFWRQSRVAGNTAILFGLEYAGAGKAVAWGNNFITKWSGACTKRACAWPLSIPPDPTQGQSNSSSAWVTANRKRKYGCEKCSSAHVKPRTTRNRHRHVGAALGQRTSPRNVFPRSHPTAKIFASLSRSASITS